MVKEGETPTYCYELYSPLAPQEFFKHELLGTLLKQKLDDEDYDKLKSLFVVHNETSTVALLWFHSCLLDFHLLCSWYWLVISSKMNILK